MWVYFSLGFLPFFPRTHLLGSPKTWRWTAGQRLQDPQQLAELRTISVGRQDRQGAFGKTLVAQLADVNVGCWSSCNFQKKIGGSLFLRKNKNKNWSVMQVRDTTQVLFYVLLFFPTRCRHFLLFGSFLLFVFLLMSYLLLLVLLLSYHVYSPWCFLILL